VTNIRRHLRVAVGLGAALVALSLFLVWARPFAPVEHRSGEGPLTSPGDAWSMGLDPTKSDRWTLGVYLCAADPSSVPVLDSVTPVRTLGSFDFLGASMRRFAPSNSHPPIISLDGYPPKVPDALAPAAGYRVEAGCSQEAEFSDYNELLLGIARRGDLGGGWLGEEVRYHVGDRHYILDLDYVVMVCGPSVPKPYC
jgi:hypothetical protein